MRLLQFGILLTSLSYSFAALAGGLADFRTGANRVDLVGGHYVDANGSRIRVSRGSSAMGGTKLLHSRSSEKIAKSSSNTLNKPKRIVEQKRPSQKVDARDVTVFTLMASNLASDQLKNRALNIESIITKGHWLTHGYMRQLLWPGKAPLEVSEALRWNLASLLANHRSAKSAPFLTPEAESLLEGVCTGSSCAR